MTMAKSWGMEPGNIRISGTGVISQYLDDPKATAKSFRWMVLSR